MSFTMKCARCILLLSYTLLWIACLCLLYVGSRAVFLADTYSVISSETQLRVAGITFICTGLLILATCIIGLIAWLKRSRLLLVIVCTLLIVILFCEIGAVLLSVFHWSGVQGNLTKLFQFQMDKYSEDASAQKYVDYIQQTLQCCGAESPEDWNVTKYYHDVGKYPKSCFSAKIVTQTEPLFNDLSPVDTLAPTEHPFAQGCTTLLSERFHLWFSLIIAVGLVFVLIQILGSHTSCIVFCHASPTSDQTFPEEPYARL